MLIVSTETTTEHTGLIGTAEEDRSTAANVGTRAGESGRRRHIVENVRVVAENVLQLVVVVRLQAEILQQTEIVLIFETARLTGRTGAVLRHLQK